MNELKPCPFCGGKAKIEEISCGTESQNSVRLSFWIHCVKCRATAPGASGHISINLSHSGELNLWHDDRESAIGAWNRRMNNETY